jgi:hypothetical protein
MMQGSAVRDYVVLHEVFGAGVERLQLGAPISHRLRLPLSAGNWLINITVTAGVSNVSFSAKLADDHPGAKVLGGSHNGAMSPHFSPATMTAFIDDAVVSPEKPLDLVVTFESVGPNAIAVLGHRSISVMAWKKLEPTVAAKPKAAKAAPPKPVAAVAAAQAEPVAIKQPTPKKPTETQAPAPAPVAVRKEPPPKAKPAPVAPPAAPVAKTPTKTSVSAVKPKAASKSAPPKAAEKPAPEKAVAAKPAPAKATSAKRK